jgi:hypothetical protein
LLVRGTKAQAEEVKQACKMFLRDELGLALSEEKTKVTHIQDGFDFLGYHIFRCNRTSNGRRVGVWACSHAQPLKVNDDSKRKSR